MFQSKIWQIVKILFLNVSVYEDETNFTGSSKEIHVYLAGEQHAVGLKTQSWDNFV